MQRQLERRRALKELQQEDDQRRAETERLLAGHFHRRTKRIARGFSLTHRKLPRGLHHALSARHPVTRRKLLQPMALVLYDCLLESAQLPADSSGARRVFGRTQAFYARRLGLSMRRGRNGEVHGARRIRTLLTQLVHVGLVRKGGRAWFDETLDKHPRLVLWLLPWESSVVARYADALASDGERIPGSGSFTDHTEINSEVCDHLGGLGGSPEEKERPPAAVDAQPPSAAGNDEEIASGTPAVVAVLGPAALRVFRGAELAAIIRHVATLEPQAHDTAEGRLRRVPSPARCAAAKNPEPSSRLVDRPHREPCDCSACRAWARQVVAAPGQKKRRSPPDERLPTRPPSVYLASGGPVTPQSTQSAKRCNLDELLAKLTARFKC